MSAFQSNFTLCKDHWLYNVEDVGEGCNFLQLYKWHGIGTFRPLSRQVQYFHCDGIVAVISQITINLVIYIVNTVEIMRALLSQDAYMTHFEYEVKSWLVRFPNWLIRSSGWATWQGVGPKVGCISITINENVQNIFVYPEHCQNFSNRVGKTPALIFEVCHI